MLVGSVDDVGLVLDEAGLVLDEAGLVFDDVGLVLDEEGLELVGFVGDTVVGTPSSWLS